MAQTDLAITIAFCGIALFLDLMLLIDSYSTYSDDAIEIKKIRQLFFAGIVQSVAYFVEYIINSYDFFGLHSLAMAVESAVYISNLFYSVSYADLIFSKYKQRIYDKNISHFMFFSPILILLMLEALNIFYPIFFYIVPETLEYVELPMVWVANIVPILYIVFSAVNDIKDWRKNTHYYNLPISLYFTIVIAGIVLESLFCEYPIIPIFCYISMALYYNRAIKRIGYIDSLSGLFTRAHLNIYINSLLSGKQSSKAMIAGIMLDVNRFKSINDTLGHVAGDRAIRIVGSLLKQATKKSGICFRYGGDEFVVILKITDISEIEACINRINQATAEFNATKAKPFELSLSQGYTIYDKKKDSAITFIERMDAEMYKNKLLSR